MPAFRITNITHIATKGRGHFLDLGVENGGKHIAVGGQRVLEAASVDLLPSCILSWKGKGWVKITNLDTVSDSAAVNDSFSGELTPRSVNPVKEVNSEDDFDADPDLHDAVPAVLPENTGPIAGSTAQTARGARVTDAAAEERYSTDISPIPGDKPRNVDDTDQFTVRAKPSNMPGAVIRSK